MTPPGSGDPRPIQEPPRTHDLALLTSARTLRGLGAGMLSVVLVLELARAGYSPLAIGIALGGAMAASAAWSILVPGGYLPFSPRGRFAVGALAVAAGGLLLWFQIANPWILLLALVLGGIVAGGADISPLGALEQGAVSRAAEDRERTRTFAVYNLAGYLGTAAGALLAGPLSDIAWAPAGAPAGPRDIALLLYALLGLALIPTYFVLSTRALPADTGRSYRPLSPASRGPVLRLSGLFTVDAFGGGMASNAIVTLFLLLRFQASAGTIGAILAIANVAAAASLLLAVPLAKRFGLVNTMVFTHIPSSVLLILFAFAPTVAIAAVLWVARATLSQMDVPTRQSYTQAIVPREEGPAAAGYTTAARSAQALGSPVSGALFAAGGPWLEGPFAIAGSVKIAYDLALYRGFRHRRPPEEQGPAGNRA